MTTERRTANLALLAWGVLMFALVVSMPEPSIRDRSWIDTAFLIIVAGILGTANIRLRYGSINMSGAAICAAIATVSPFQAALVGFTGHAQRAWQRRHVDVIPTNVGTAFWGASGAAVRVLFISLGVPTPIAVAIALLFGVAVNVLSTSVALSFLHSTPALQIVRRIVTPALIGAYVYFMIAAALASTMLGHSYEGLVRASGLFALAIAVGDSVGGRTIRAFLQRQLVAVEPHVQYSQLAQGTFHDLRNLVSAAIANLQEVDAEGLPADSRGAVAAAADALEDARSVLSNAEASGRVSGMAHFTKVDLAELCQHMGALHKPAASSRRVAMVIRTPESDASAFGHPVLLGEVLTNLILNAIDATPIGGSILIECRSTLRGSTVTVMDTGAGVSEESSRRIFEPGFTTKGGRGTGLGLYTALGIARQHHGDLTYEPQRSGRGATFKLSLPDFPSGVKALGRFATEQQPE